VVTSKKRIGLNCGLDPSACDRRLSERRIGITKRSELLDDMTSSERKEGRLSPGKFCK
jgi:hypothetical protein